VDLYFSIIFSRGQDSERAYCWDIKCEGEDSVIAACKKKISKEMILGFVSKFFYDWKI